jgi:hypothetical protein
MPSRLIIMILTGVIVLMIAKIVTIGHDFEKGPLPKGCRKKFLNLLYRTSGKVWVFVAGFCCSSLVEVDADYSEYLGSDYK